MNPSDDVWKYLIDHLPTIINTLIVSFAVGWATIQNRKAICKIDMGNEMNSEIMGQIDHVKKLVNVQANSIKSEINSKESKSDA